MVWIYFAKIRQIIDFRKFLDKIFNMSTLFKLIYYSIQDFLANFAH